MQCLFAQKPRQERKQTGTSHKRRIRRHPISQQDGDLSCQDSVGNLQINNRVHHPTWFTFKYSNQNHSVTKRKRDIARSNFSLRKAWVGVFKSRSAFSIQQCIQAFRTLSVGPVSLRLGTMLKNLIVNKIEDFR